jgi:MFS family permease
VAQGLVERVAPARLGRPFRWLLASSWTTNLGDGILVATGPLLVASETRDPFLVGLSWTLQFLPALLFGLYAGVVADRVDRQLLVAFADGARVLVLGVLATAILTGHVDIVLVLGALFLLGTAETFADTATSTLLPMMVAKRDLGIANARVMGGIILLNQLAGPPIGAALFALGRAVPFFSMAVLVLAGVVLVLRVRLPVSARPDVPREKHLGTEIREGLVWVRDHPAVRTLVVTILVFNITFGAAWSVLVLYSLERLHLGEIGFGLVTTAQAVGGLIGTFCFGWLERHVRLGTLMRVGLVIETLTHLALALTTVVWVAMVVFVVFGAHAFVWGTISQAVRQRAVPMAMQGRVNSVNRIGVVGGIVVGSLVGGAIASRFGVTGPFWFGFAGSAVFLVLLWRALMHVAHADEESLAQEG